MSASTNAVASSSRRPSVSSSTAPPNKRPRTEEADDDEDEDDHLNELDDSTRAKMERKQARTIRNRESAQRSRNQRKAHLANLEVRVAELERENRALRGETTGNTPPPPNRSAEREVSPAQSVISLANDLGIPHDMVTYGVNLATVAPPPRDLDDNVDVKPVVAASSPARPTASTFVDVPALQSENAALRERIGLLENLVKQVVALSNLGGLPQSAPPAPTAQASHDSVEPFDWNTLVVPPQPSHLSPTLSPTLYPTQSLDKVKQLVVKSETSEMNLACHPAAVVTCAGAPNTSQALQRARTNSSLGGNRRGQASGMGQGRDVAIDFAPSSQVGARAEGSMFEDGEETNGEMWDEGMRLLLNDLEGVGADKEARRGEEVQEQEQVRLGEQEEFGWMFGGGVQKSTAVLGLAV